MIIKSIFKIRKIIFETKNNNNDSLKLFFNNGLKFGLSINENVSDEIYDEKVKYFKNEIDYFNKKLQNRSFLEKAPKNVVEEQKRKLNNAIKNLKKLKNSLK